MSERLIPDTDDHGHQHAVFTATSPRLVPSDSPLDHPHLYFNRELSWLDFNWRVLSQAVDEFNPVLERARFLAITSTNLDEFFRKRVGGLKRQAAAGVQTLSPDGRTPTEQLSLIRRAVVPFYATMGRVWRDAIHPALREIGIVIRSYHELSADERNECDVYFRDSIFPILTPLAVDPGHPFPFISNLSLSLAVQLRHPTRGTEHFARLKVPTRRGRWLQLKHSGQYVPIEQIIAANAHELFRGMIVESVHPFRISRNADVSRSEEEADDLLEMISEELRERRFAPVVRLEADVGMPEPVRSLLMRELSLTNDDVYLTDGMLDYDHLTEFANLNIPAHRFEPWQALTPIELLHEGDSTDRTDMFTVLRQRDLLVHHPYESFRASTQRFIEEAAEDPSVLAIKQTLYRTSDESPVVKALIRAAEAGKEVAVLVEVKARFDEQNNMEWGQVLERSGVHVTYGLVGLKTHCKTTLVIREEEEGPRAYCHIGTGNYNPITARLYTDLGYFTAKQDVGTDLINLFHFITGYAPQQEYESLIVAPRDMRSRFEEMVRIEIANQKAHGNGRIIAKMNALDDVGMIQELYRASQAGVAIELIVRGHCRLRPGVPGFSESIHVRSIVGRYLEHSRIYYFHNNGQPKLFLGSADWQRRNLDDRVECLVGIEDVRLKDQLMHILNASLRDSRSAWALGTDGVYRRTAVRHDYQQELMEAARRRALEAEEE